MTHRDRAGDASGQRAGRREAAGDPGRKPWEAVSMGHYQRSLVLDGPGAVATDSGPSRSVRLFLIVFFESKTIDRTNQIKPAAM